MGESLKRAAAWVLLSLAALSLMMFGVAAPASASGAPSCYGVSCDNVNPSDTNCVDDAYTLMSRHATTPLTGEDVGILELRYSPKCHSNWVRFTPWFGIRTLFANSAGGGQARGLPWIWRQGVADSLRGAAGQSTVWDIRTQTVWTTMVTADGTTCSSVSLYASGMKDSGQIDYESLGPYNAPCVS